MDATPDARPARPYGDDPAATTDPSLSDPPLSDPPRPDLQSEPRPELPPDPSSAPPPDPSPPELAELRPQRDPATLHQPMRWVVALAEVLIAVVLCVAVAWAWERGSVTYELPASQNAAVPDAVQRWSGPWIGAAFALAALAGALVLDAVRQVMLAARTPNHGWQTALDD